MACGDSVGSPAKQSGFDVSMDGQGADQPLDWVEGNSRRYRTLGDKFGLNA